MDLVVQRYMDDMKKLTEAFGNNDMGILKHRIKETNKKINKLQSIVNQLNDTSIVSQFQEKKQELFESIAQFIDKHAAGDFLTLGNIKELSEMLSSYEKFGLLKGLEVLLKDKPEMKEKYSNRMK